MRGYRLPRCSRRFHWKGGRRKNNAAPREEGGQEKSNGMPEEGSVGKMMIMKEGI
jgi:hypothetical protein